MDHANQKLEFGDELIFSYLLKQNRDLALDQIPNPNYHLHNILDTAIFNLKLCLQNHTSNDIVLSSHHSALYDQNYIDMENLA